MTALEKQVSLKNVLQHNCQYCDGCHACDFCEPEDDTDGEFFCAIRDNEKRIPFYDNWDIGSGLITDL